MDVAQLEMFSTVSGSSSLSVAAKELGLSQPGLSRQLQRLERTLGVQLLVRSSTGVRLTRAGEQYRAFTIDALARHSQLLADLRQSSVGVIGELRMASSTTLAEFVLPGLIAQFQARHPDVQATIFEADSETVAQEVIERRWELGFVGARVRAKGLRYLAIGSDEVVLAIPSNHPLAEQHEIQLASLANQVFLERAGGSGTIKNVHHALAEHGLALPKHRISMSLGTTLAVVSAVRAGYGIGFVSSLALNDPQAIGVVGKRLEGMQIIRWLYLIRERGRPLSDLGSRFLDFVHQQTDQWRSRTVTMPSPG